MIASNHPTTTSRRHELEAEIADIQRQRIAHPDRERALVARLRELREQLELVAQVEPREIPGLPGRWVLASGARAPVIGWLLNAPPWRRGGTRPPTRDELDALHRLEWQPLDHPEGWRRRGDGERCVTAHAYEFRQRDADALTSALAPLGLRWSLHGRRSGASWYGAGHGLELGTALLVVARAAIVEQERRART